MVNKLTCKNLQVGGGEEKEPKFVAKFKSGHHLLKQVYQLTRLSGGGAGAGPKPPWANFSKQSLKTSPLRKVVTHATDDTRSIC